jgi:colanic acid biosynthesis glycosyl transferase WcaI
MMRILIYGAYFQPDLIGIGKYTGEMAAWLAQQGHDVRVIAAPPYYPEWRIKDGYTGGRYKIERSKNLLVWRCPVWVPGRPTGIKRILHYVSFALSSAPVVIRQALRRPDVIIVVAPPLFCAPMAWFSGRIAGARIWLHVQDFEVDAAFEMGLLQVPALRRIALFVERQLMRRFDRVSTISKNMFARLRIKGVTDERCVLFQNWVDTEAICPLRATSGFRRELGIADETVVALYSGSMGEKQGLDGVLEAARRLKGEDSLRFVICGEGATRERLLQKYGDLANVIWLPLQPVSRLNDLLNLADIHLLPQSADVADLVMPSKLTGMLASGHPVIATAGAGTQIDEVVSQCGIVVPPGDDYSLAMAIQRLTKDRVERQRLGEAARNYACDNMDLTRVLMKFERALLSIRGKAA